MKIKNGLRYLLVLFMLFTTNSIAAPWIEINDLSLRNDIQLLADSGLITVPVTTYPLMWQAIMPEVTAAKVETLPPSQVSALLRIQKEFQQATGSISRNSIRLYAATTARRFTSYGQSDYDEGSIELSHEYQGESLSGKLQVNYRAGLDHNNGINQGNDYNMDGSYLSYQLGNWILTGGAIDRWWGPSIDSNLILSDNARPLPSVNLSRVQSTAFETPWLSWLGTWTANAQMAKLESDRYIPDALIWSARGAIRPFRGLEFGASWSFQWAGEGQPSSMKDFFEILFGGLECANGDPTCDPELNTAQGNHLAGYDIRWSDSLFDTTYALYTQVIGEDGSPNAGLITDKASLYGAELRFQLFEQNILANVEYTDTQVNCIDAEDTSLNCFYEHTLVYHSGYRYYRRAIGSTYDNDAETFVMTFLGQLTNGNNWQVKIRQAKLNTNGKDRFPDDVNMGNTVSKVAENILQIDSQYNFTW